MTGLLRSLWDRLSLYLPILLMGVFALATWWLVRSTPAAIESLAARPAKHEADYFLGNFAIKSFDAKGRIKSEVFGTQARHFPDTDTLEIEQVRTRTFSDTGRLTVSSAKRALSDAQGDDVQLFGNVLVVREPQPGTSGPPQPPVEFRSEYLHIFSETEKLLTHLPVVISQGADRFSGNAMSYDNIDERVELRGQVHGLLIPRKAP